MEEVWKIMGEQLFFIHRAFGVKVISFVLMSNHFHLIIQTPECNLDAAMGWFMRETSRSLTRAGNRQNQSYGGRYFRSILSTDLYFLHAYKYVYLNPLQAGAAGEILDYPFSTLPCVLGLQPLSFAVHDELLLNSTEETLQWLGRVPDLKSWDFVKRALRRREFQLAKLGRAANPLEAMMF